MNETRPPTERLEDAIKQAILDFDLVLLALADFDFRAAMGYATIGRRSLVRALETQDVGTSP